MSGAISRSINPEDYQNLAQTVGAMAKAFSDGHVIGLHSHARDQLLYATRGIMRLQTEREAWIVPHDTAVYIPAGISHSVSMHGEVEMRTLYIDTNVRAHTPRALCVVAITPLLRELILALNEEPMDYPPESRGGFIARLIELELAQATEVSLRVPLPKDTRLQRLCAALMADPSDSRSLEGWTEVAGASARTLARLFQRDLGMSFHGWRQRVRFHHALEGLTKGLPISRVAHDHGYRSASAFSAAFRKEMGVTPSRVSHERTHVT